MATLYTHQDSNIRKTWLLIGTFLIVVIGIGWFASFYYDDPTILFIAVFFAIFMNIFSYWYSDKIVLAMHRAKEVTRESHPDLWNMTENLAITAGLPMPRLYIIREASPNAFATGRNKEHAAVAVTSGLMQILDKSEMEGVIAHELAHIGNRDILVMTIVVVLVGFVTLLADFFTRSLWWGGGRDRDNKAGGILMIIGLVLMILSPIFATLIQLAVSRRREFLADASGALLTRYPEGLANALKKIHAHSAGHPMRTANKATAHMFIANPFGGKKRNVSKFFMTHPPVEERIQALLNK